MPRGYSATSSKPSGISAEEWRHLITVWPGSVAPASTALSQALSERADVLFGAPARVITATPGDFRRSCCALRPCAHVRASGNGLDMFTSEELIVDAGFAADDTTRIVVDDDR